MLIRKDQDLNELETEIFDIIVGIDDEKKQEQQKKACQKSLTARRAVEELKQKKQLEYEINDEHWFDDL